MFRRVWLAAAVMLVAAPSRSIAQAPAQAQTQRIWTLEDAVVAALAQHPLVEAARARVDAAHSERDGVRAVANPVGTFWMENDRPRESSLYFTYPIESIFQRGPRVRRADEDIRAAVASLTLARRLVAVETVRAFFGVALAQALHEEAEENRDRLEQLVSYNRARVGEGVTAEGELLRLEVELARAANDVVLSEVEHTRSRARLAPYLGSDGAISGLASIRASVPAPAASPLAPIPTLDIVLASARVGRPEIVSSRARAASAAAAVQFERSLTMRSLGATLGSKRVEGRSALVAGVSITIPVFNLNGGPIARAASERNAAEQELMWVERSVSTAVQGTHAAATQLTRQLGELQQTFLSRAEHVHELTLTAYQEGGATLLQVLDATRMLADARLTYARTLFAQRESLFDLALATGSEPTDALGLLRTWSTAPIRASRAGDEP
jgi:outer membrane protein, heavy metal efflux system